MKIAIIYASYHHKNTYKLLMGIKDKFDIDLYDALQHPKINIQDYDSIGFASGIYFSSMHHSLDDYLSKIEKTQQTFLISTCGFKYKNYVAKQENYLKGNSRYLGAYTCKGYDTYGILKCIGGISKNHPNQDEIDKTISFIQTIKKGELYETQ